MRIASSPLSTGFFPKGNSSLGVEPKIGGGFPPKWMVKIVENPMNKWDDLGGTIIFGNTPFQPFIFMGELLVSGY